MILIISTCKRSLHELEFVNPVKALFDEPKVTGYKDVNSDDLSMADAVIITGTSLKDTEYLDNKEKFDWIKTYDKPLIGICAGAQLIALNHFGSLRNRKEIGNVRIKGKNPFPPEFEAYGLHKNGIEPASDFTILAENDMLQAFRYKNKIGMLFHPEVRHTGMLKKIVLDLIQELRN